jgi:hypothetical protein
MESNFSPILAVLALHAGEPVVLRHTGAQNLKDRVQRIRGKNPTEKGTVLPLKSVHLPAHKRKQSLNGSLAILKDPDRSLRLVNRLNRLADR